MTTNTSSRLPTWFWIVAIIAILWNGMGVGAYLMEVTMSEEAMAALPAAQQALHAAQPAWVTGAFAIAVFAGLAGSFALAFRKGLAAPILAVSLVAAFAQMFYVFAMTNTMAVMGATSAIMPAVILAIGAFLVWFSMNAKGRGWLS